MTKEIHPVGPVSARIQVPGSKSITNRALICASLAKGESIIQNASDSDDTALMVNGLNQLGVLVRRNGDSLIVEGSGARLYAPKFPIPVGNAGTTLRFLLSLGALAEGRTVFESDARMADRPVNALLDALQSLGAAAQALGTRYLVQGGGINGGSVKLNAEKSSQFLSSLLMVSSYAKHDVLIEVEGRLSSAPYIDTTIDVMAKFGVHVGRTETNRYTVTSGQRYTPAEFLVEPDSSSASYFFAAAAIAGGEVRVEGLRLESLQGDVRFAEVLRTMGCGVGEEESGVRMRGAGRLAGVDVDMNAMPDLVPTLSVMALFAVGRTRIRNVAHLRYKESNRLEALTTELRKLGANVTLLDDGLEIMPAPLHGARLDTYEDHRLAMSFALVGLKVSGVLIENPDCVRKSFPTFWREFEKLYA